ncbi:MAG: DUF3147 family protein [Puniceicoccaceae bacterium]|nr:MAG: DUF3147 family protein [Puniceicoccaceae bacterium]
MLEYLTKLLLSAIVIVVVSEVAKRSGYLGALIASLPLTSLLAITWLYLDTGDIEKVRLLTTGIFWLVLPSLVFFLVLPLLLQQGLAFWFALGLSILSTMAAYALMWAGLARFQPGG